MRIVTFKIDEELLEKLDEYAQRVKKPRSEIIREAIREYLERRETEDVKRVAARVKIIKILS